MPEWTLTLEIERTEYDADALVRLSDFLERRSGELGPAVGLHAGKTAITLTVNATTLAEAVREAMDVIASVIEELDDA